jgi:DNA-binding NarL/FixJ family response regulator
MTAYRIVLADDHALFRQGLKGIIDGKADLEVVGEAGDGLELLKILEKAQPQMTILDISMPNLRGIEALHEIKKTYPEVKVLILTMHKDAEYLHQAIAAGAEGYLLKEDADPDLFSAIEKVRQGKIYISPRLSDDMVDDWAQMRRGDRVPSGDPLTVREREVLKLIAEGKSSKEVGDILFISARTVERHRANIMGKLKLKNTAEMVKYALHKGYV